MDAINFDFSQITTLLLPIVSGFAGWFAQSWRTKEKKENDILANVQQIVDMQKDYIASQNKMLDEYKKDLDESHFAIQNAYKCKTSNDKCPVLNTKYKFSEVKIKKKDSKDGYNN